MRLKPADLAPDHVFLRRAYLDATGILPTPDEARAFLASADPGKREEAYRWLSRGLEEAILGFIGRADGDRFALRASVYEFTHMPVLEAFAAAAAGGADVKIVYDRRKR